jgi:TnpA family transposase
MLFFDETDRRLIARRRRDSNRLGFALQLGTVRYLGRFLEHPSEVPPAVVRYVAAKLEIADPGVFGEYARREAPWDHQLEIRRRYELREFSDPAAQAELLDWLGARAWVGAETHGVFFDRTVDI